jgi:small subunit ribosomal protein S6
MATIAPPSSVNKKKPSDAPQEADDQSQDVRTYECIVLYPYPLSQKEEQDLLKEIDSLFSEAEAKELSRDTWGRRGLAYPIGGYTEGVYVVYNIEADPSKIKELDRSLRIAKNVLRHLIIKPQKYYEVIEYSKKYEEWKQESKVAKEVAKKHHEEELKRKVVERVTRKSKTQEAPKKEETPKAVEKKKLSAELEKIISDEDLDL